MFSALSSFSHFAQKIKDSLQIKPKILVLFGSEKHNAEGMVDTLVKDKDHKAHDFDLSKMTLDYYFEPLISEYNKTGSYKSDNRAVENIIIVCSTTGDGEAPKGADKFFRFIERTYRTIQKDKDKKSSIDLQHINYTVLALGDSNYDKFCYVGKRIDFILKSFGAFCVKPLTLADAANNEKEVVDDFIENVWEPFRFEDVNDEIKSKAEDNPNFKSKIESYFGARHSAGSFSEQHEKDKEVVAVKKDDKDTVAELQEMKEHSVINKLTLT